MSALATKFALARAQLGIVESPVNVVKFNDAFYGRKVNGSAYPWCQAFMWWLATNAGLAAIFPPKTAATTTAASWYQRNGRWGTQPRPGAHVFYDWGHGIAHTGLCETSLLPGGYFSAIEGNTGRPGQSQDNGGMVLRQARSLRALGRNGGFGYPDYNRADVTSLVLPKVPVGESVDLEVGARRPDVLPALRRGATGGWVGLAQKCLRIDIDTSFGPASERAVVGQQRRYGLVADGVIGSWTWVSFVADAGANLAPGTSGHPGIEVLQNMIGLRGDELDGSYGRVGAARVRAVQRWAGLEPDAIVGPATRAALTRG